MVGRGPPYGWLSDDSSVLQGFSFSNSLSNPLGDVMSRAVKLRRQRRSMRRLASASTAVFLFALTGCAHRALQVEPMELCYATELSAYIASEDLQRALVQAQAFSNSRYGEDCFVCAELLGFEQGEIHLHIRSPLPDPGIDTSATLKVRALDGHVVESRLYHSCHARVLPMAP
jgi:hypothetical protein